MSDDECVSAGEVLIVTRKRNNKRKRQDSEMDKCL